MRSFFMLGLTLSQFAYAATIFQDDFESATFDPFWTVIQQSGSVSLTNSVAHGGNQSAGFVSTSGTQREMHLRHDFVTPQKGTASVWFYDSQPGSETLYAYMALSNSTDPNASAAVGAQDFDAFCYLAGGPLGGGPNQNCGIYPQTTTTNISRTAGWHLLEAAFLTAGGHISIDGTVVYAFSGDYAFDRIDFALSGPVWRPNTTAYWDDFLLTDVSSVPEPGGLLLAGTALGLLLIGRGARRRKG